MSDLIVEKKIIQILTAKIAELRDPLLKCLSILCVNDDLSEREQVIFELLTRAIETKGEEK